MKTRKFSHTVKNGIIVGAGTLVLSVIFSLGSQFFMKFLDSIFLEFVLLLTIILTGVLFDIIGVSAAVANESPFHAQAAKKIYGARQAVRIVRNADRVASFSNDVVGDISGILSGAIGTAILYEFVSMSPGINEVLMGTLLTGCIAGLTVGGKAVGKSIAIDRANNIVLKVGKFLAFVEETFGIKILAGRTKKGRKR